MYASKANGQDIEQSRPGWELADKLRGYLVAHGQEASRNMFMLVKMSRTICGMDSESADAFHCNRHSD